jgi:hypothetical protein
MNKGRGGKKMTPTQKESASASNICQRRRAKCITALLVLLLPTTAWAENWVSIYQTQYVSVQVDRDSIRPVGNYVTYWTRTWPIKGANPDYAYEEAVNCANRTKGFGLLDSNAPGRGGLTALDQMNFGPTSDPAIAATIQFVCR